MFPPYLYIDVGRTNAMFTLNELYPHDRVVGGRKIVEYRSMYHQNLGCDPKESYQKALKKSREMHLPLRSSLNSISTKLRDIKRNTKEENERLRLLHIKKHSDKMNGYVERYDNRYMRNLVSKGGVFNFGFGKYIGRYMIDILSDDIGYIRYLIEGDFIDDLTRFQLETIIENYPIKVDKSSEYVGEVGERYNFEAIVKRVIPFETQYGCSAVITLADNNDNDLVLFTTAEFPDIGVPFTFAAKVKEHKEYNDVKQTVLQRPTKIKEVE